MTFVDLHLFYPLTSVLGEADGQRRFLDFLFKQILFVQEKNDRGISEPLVVADGVKQLQRFLHTVLLKKEGWC